MLKTRRQKLFYRKINKILLVCLIIGLTCLLLAKLARKNNHQPVVFPKKSFEVTLISSVLTPIITPTPPLPTLTPTPTPFPLVGFCLKVPILMYHHIQPFSQAIAEKHNNLTVDDKNFEGQINYLISAGYKTISAQDLANALVNKQNLPEKSMVLTFDDGYSDIYNFAFPLAKKYQVILNLMIPTGLIGNPGYLTWEELKEMSDSGLVFSYNHTWSHLSLGAYGKEKIESEVGTAKTQLEEHLGKQTTVFAYPYGSNNSLVMYILASNGYNAALSIIPGFDQCDSLLMALHRTRIGNDSLSSYGL